MEEAPRPNAGMSLVLNVYFGLLLATSFTVDSATQITAIAPAHAPGPVAVVVNTMGGCAVSPATLDYVSGTYRITEAGDRRATELGERILVN